ncbi:MAG TPA: hypothetical protein VGE98_15125 [Thermoanaerobaculia bacterium]
MIRSLRSTAVLLVLMLVPAALLAVTPVGPEVSVRVQQGGRATHPLVGVFADGGFVVAWTTGSPKTVIHARLFDATGAPASGEFRLAQPANQYLDDLAVMPGGDFLLVWEQPRSATVVATSVVARRYDRHGVPRTPAFVVHDPSPGAVYNARLAATPDGGFAVAWTQDIAVPNNVRPRRDTFVRSFGANNAPLGPALLVEQGSIGDDSFLLPGSLAAAPNGTLALASDCLCDQVTVEVHRIVPGVGVQLLDAGNDDTVSYDSSLAMAADGSFLVAFQTDNSVIRARRFAADGTPQGDAFQVNRRGSSENQPFVAALAGGEFVVVWTDIAGRDGDGWGIYSRGYAADGATFGPDLLVNQVAAGGQLATGVAAADQAVAVWVAPGPTFDVFHPNGTDVRVRRLRPH